MVYWIKPRPIGMSNGEVGLEYQRSRTAKGSWLDYVRKEESVAEQDAPTLIKSEHPTLPDAFDIGSGFWCVSDKVKDLMQRLFGSSQVTFYELLVRNQWTNERMPSTNFVTFSRFCDLIDWPRSRTKARRLREQSETELVSLIGVPGDAVFKSIPTDQEMIWIEKSVRQGNQLFSPGVFNVYATDIAAETIAAAFPGPFGLRKHRQASAANSSET
jgi:hypothetical protein